MFYNCITPKYFSDITSLIFLSASNVRKFGMEASALHVDGTFSICPQIFCQVLVLSFEFKGKVMN